MFKFIKFIFLGLFEAIGAILQVLTSLISIIPVSKNNKPNTGFIEINDSGQKLNYRGNDINEKDNKFYEFDN